MHFCRCNLHGACGGKDGFLLYVGGRIVLQSARSVWRQSARPFQPSAPGCGCNLHGACGGKAPTPRMSSPRSCCNLHGACGGKACRRKSFPARRRVAICTERVEAKGKHSPCFAILPWLQSARSVWRQRSGASVPLMPCRVAICTERVEAKEIPQLLIVQCFSLQSARSVWRQSDSEPIIQSSPSPVAICTERVEAKA